MEEISPPSSILLHKVGLYDVDIGTTSLERTSPPIKDPLRRGQPFKHISNIREEDNLSLVDKMAGPNVSFIRRVHYI